MTNKEAIELLTEMRNTTGLNEDVCCAIDLSIEALEKTQKKKPEEFYDGYSDGYPVIEYKCPVCGWELDDTDDHCPICDQKIDWDLGFDV